MSTIKPEALETLAGMGADETDAATALSISVGQFHSLLAGAEYAAAWESGQTKANINVATALYAAACAGNVQAQVFWLTNRQPDRWGKTKGKATPKVKSPFSGLRLKKA